MTTVAPSVSAALLSSQRRRQGQWVLGTLACSVLIATAAAVAVGPIRVDLLSLLHIGLQAIGIGDQHQIDPIVTGVVQSIRAPRAVLGLLAGASLGIAGAAMQGFFRNPLADPGLIGVSAGGALAAVAVIVLGGGALAGVALSTTLLPLAAFVGALATVALIYGLSLWDGRVIVATMLLAGVAANALAFSGIGYLTFLADDNQLRDLTFWTLGSLGGATWARVMPAALAMVVAIAGLLRLQRPLNALLMGETDARCLGVDAESTKRQAAVFTALGVGAATAVCGIVSFVGLVVPHLVRLLAGPDHRVVLPGSALLGGSLILGADLIARIAVAPAELPLGVVTAALGAPFFLWLLLRNKRHGGLG
nr:iron ABC transporter permease [Oceanococcus sp. HetDA_MAG_MS8]